MAFLETHNELRDTGKLYTVVVHVAVRISTRESNSINSGFCRVPPATFFISMIIILSGLGNSCSDRLHLAISWVNSSIGILLYAYTAPLLDEFSVHVSSLRESSIYFYFGNFFHLNRNVFSLFLVSSFSVDPVCYIHLQIEVIPFQLFGWIFCKLPFRNVKVSEQ